MINRSQLNFHETFQPEAGYLAKILELSSQNYSGSKFEISEETGIPTGNKKGKVEPHIRYATYMGLIQYKLDKGVYTLSLSPLGEEVYAQDKYLHEDLTKWLCHYHITRSDSGAPQWAFVFNDTHIGFSQELGSARLNDAANQKWGLEIAYEEAFGVARRSYLDGFFSELELISVDGSGAWSFKELYEKDELLYVYAYAILNSWEKLLSDKSEITVFELTEQLSFGKVFGLNDDSINEVLEMLSDEGILTLNRQLFPMTIIRTADSMSVISDLYSRLL